MPDSSSAGVRSLRQDGVARIVLDRPRSLNALTLPMIRRIHELLESWRTEPLRAITIESATAGMFCAGGDIRQMRQNTLAGDHELNEEFFATEYAVNEMLASYTVPVVAIVDGVCMGGGLGLSVHGQFRVVSERAILAMPETAIGFFPDVGSSYFLSRLPGGVGAYLGLTGARLDAADALEIGLATHHVASESASLIPKLLAYDRRPVDAVLRDLGSAPAQESEIAVRRRHIDKAFTAASVALIVRRLVDDGSEWAVATRETLRGMSPQSLELTMDLILWGKQRSLRDCLDAELAAARHVVLSPDFIEGVRSVLVDKDRSPAWGPSQYGGTSSDGEIIWNRAHADLPPVQGP